MGYGTGSRQLTEREKLVADIKLRRSNISYYERGMKLSQVELATAEKALADYDAAEEARGMAAVKA